jgi:dipeptidyl aminopeptidase/acylaminoacyl peptidase
MQLTTSKASLTPRWSPDGRWIVYDTQTPDGHWDIHVVESATGGPPAAVVRHSADDVAPSFSADGNWIYFRSNRGDGKNQVYRVPATGGEPVKVTENGGGVALESADGASVYYTKVNQGCRVPLFVRPLAGGPERQVLDSLCSRGFVVTRLGIYYTAGPDKDRSLTIQLFDPISGTSREVRRTTTPLGGGFSLAVSPNGDQYLIDGHAIGRDLYLVEDFH